MENNFTAKFGPCGLLCEKCFAFENGPIKHYAEQLKHNLGNFDLYAKRFVELLDEPVFGKYPDFKELLAHLAKGNCSGCRKQVCHLYGDCKVRLCYKEKGVDFCFECKEFPCNNTGFDENLNTRWLNINNKIREIGIDSYYNSIKDKPRY